MKFLFYKNTCNLSEYLFEKSVDKKDAERARQEYQRAASILGLIIVERR